MIHKYNIYMAINNCSYVSDYVMSILSINQIIHIYIHKLFCKCARFLTFLLSAMAWQNDCFSVICGSVDRTVVEFSVLGVE